MTRTLSQSLAQFGVPPSLPNAVAPEPADPPDDDDHTPSPTTLARWSDLVLKEWSNGIPSLLRELSESMKLRRVANVIEWSLLIRTMRLNGLIEPTRRAA